MCSSWYHIVDRNHLRVMQFSYSTQFEIDGWALNAGCHDHFLVEGLGYISVRSHLGGVILDKMLGKRCDVYSF